LVGFTPVDFQESVREFFGLLAECCLRDIGFGGGCGVVESAVGDV
jgi:hypothetical protein